MAGRNQMSGSSFNFGRPILNYCTTLVQSLLPGLCILCSARAAYTNLCDGCRGDLPYLPQDRCPRCALPSQAGAICGACLRQAPAFDQAFAPCAYAYPLDRAIQSFKFGGNLAVAPLLADLVASEVRSHPLPDLIVPVPLSRERLRERGFNQSLEIAKSIARGLGVALSPEACLRAQHTAPQTALAWEERAKNVAGAFVCMDDVEGRTVAVVDDVMTTGATLNELARVLRSRGATRVFGWVAARTLARS